MLLLDTNIVIDVTQLSSPFAFASPPSPLSEKERED